MKKQNRIYMLINLNAILYNLKIIKKNIQEKTKIIVVLKSDAYGCGAIKIAKYIESLSYIWGFAVSCVDEGVKIKKAGINKPILILGFIFKNDYKNIIIYNLRPTIFDNNTVNKLSKLAKKINKIVNIHIKIDTGMTRMGYNSLKSIPKILKISKTPKIKIEGIYTHFSKADENSKKPTYIQIKKYMKFINILKKFNLYISFKHCSNSAGIYIIESHMNAIRIGIILYGIYPSKQINKLLFLKQVISIKSKIMYIKIVKPNTEISYGGTFITNKITKVAIIPVGYDDGYPRSLSNKGYVLINGNKANIIGRICMNQFMVDVTNIYKIKKFDKVTLIGKDGNKNITIEKLSNISGRFPYEFMCCINKYITRIYITI